jgi:hypothetical protein
VSDVKDQGDRAPMINERRSSAAAAEAAEQQEEEERGMTLLAMLSVLVEVQSLYSEAVLYRLFFWALAVRTPGR